MTNVNGALQIEPKPPSHPPGSRCRGLRAVDWPCPHRLWAMTTWPCWWKNIICMAESSAERRRLIAAPDRLASSDDPVWLPLVVRKSAPKTSTAPIWPLLLCRPVELFGQNHTGATGPGVQCRLSRPLVPLRGGANVVPQGCRVLPMEDARNFILRRCENSFGLRSQDILRALSAQEAVDRCEPVREVPAVLFPLKGSQNLRH